MPIMDASPRTDTRGDTHGSRAASWDESPQGREGFYKMHVCLPEASAWTVIDVGKEPHDSDGFSAAATGKRRVGVMAIKAELEYRLSKFIGKEIVIHKCSAERPYGDELRDFDDVCYLT